MVRLTAEQRVVLVDKVPDLANLGVGVLVFGQFVGPQPVSFWLLSAGLVLWAVFIGAVLLIAGDSR